MSDERVEMDITITDDREERKPLFERMREVEEEIGEVEDPLVSEPFTWTNEGGKK